MSQTLTPIQTQMRELKHEQKYLRVISTTGNRVVIHFAGITEEFWFRAGAIPERTSTSVELEPHDEQVLWELARRVRSASIAGYKASDSSAKRSKVDPPTVVNKRQSRSESEIHQARSTMLYQVCSAWIADDPSFTLESVTGQAAVMTYLGAVLRVAWDPSRQRNWCDSKAWVGQDWFCFVRLFGGMMIDAAVAGYKSTNSAKQSAGLNNQIQANLRQLSWKF